MSRNPYAKALANPMFRKKIVCAKKGKGAYSRKNKSQKTFD
jgi:stalled ribosome alternative rescue factor ArfA